MFERFTERARVVIVLAQEEARLLNHNYIGTEHILLGLIREGQGVGTKALESLGISIEAVRGEIEETIGKGDSVNIGHFPFTPRAKIALEKALRALLNDTSHRNYVDTEHILMGIIELDEGTAKNVLGKLGLVFNDLAIAPGVKITVDQLRQYAMHPPLEPFLAEAKSEIERVITSFSDQLATVRNEKELGPCIMELRGDLAAIHQTIVAHRRNIWSTNANQPPTPQEPPAAGVGLADH